MPLNCFFRFGYRRQSLNLNILQFYLIRLREFFIFLIFLLIFFIKPSYTSTNSQTGITINYQIGAFIDSQTKEVLLEGKWQEVIKLLKKHDQNAIDPVAKLIMAHAYLATNQNNKSLSIFLSLKLKELNIWEKWAKSLLEKNPQNPIALYLLADAKARKGEIDKAIEYLKKAIDIKPNFPLALNSLGILYTLKGDLNNALVNFIKAENFSPELAEIHLSLGTYYILIEAPEGALEEFNKALKINPNIALAYNGRGCAYFGMGEFEKAALDFYTASHIFPSLLVTEVNYSLAITYALRAIDVANTPKKPGTSLETTLKTTLKTSQIPKELINIEFAFLDESKISSLIKKYGFENVKTAMLYDFEKSINHLTNYSSNMKNLLKTSDLKNVRNLISLNIANNLNTIAHSNFLNKLSTRTKGWSIYADPIKNLPSIEELNRWSNELRRDAVNDIMSWAKNSLISPFKPSWLSNLQTTYGFIKNLTEKPETPSEAISRLSPMAGLGGSMSGLLIPFLKSYYGLVFDALAASDIQNHMRALERNYYHEPVPKITYIPKNIASYLISGDQPLSDLGALARELNKKMNSLANTNRVLIASQNPFRTTLQELQLFRYGFKTRVVPPNIDIPLEAKRWSASAIVGIKPPKIEEITPHPIYLENKMNRYYPIGGFDGFGGGGRINWDWAKPYNPIYPKGAPGGISMKEIAKSFVDKGGWPVLTSFSLCYNPKILMEGKNEKVN